MFELNPDDALAALQRAMAFEYGSVRELEEGLIFQNSYLRLSDSGFVFEMPGGNRFRYDLDQKLVLECNEASAIHESELYQWGTVYGAIGWLNGLVPLHASCVVPPHGAIAFTAESGVGKSSLAAALSSLGLPMLCDDTLMTTIWDDSIYALPDGKPPKLSGNVAERLGLVRQNPVPLSRGKYYCEVNFRATDPAALKDIVLIEDGPELSLTSVTGSQKLELLSGALYRGFIHQALHSNLHHADLLIGLAKRVRCWKLQRPRNLSELVQFSSEVVDLIQERVPE